MWKVTHVNKKHRAISKMDEPPYLRQSFRETEPHCPQTANGERFFLLLEYTLYEQNILRTASYRNSGYTNTSPGRLPN